MIKMLKNFTVRCLIIVCLIECSAVCGDTEEPCEDKEWDYEPRSWLSDEQAYQGDDMYEVDASQDTTDTETFGHHEDPHGRHNFFGAASNDENVRQANQKPAKEECNQFRVDIREAVVCEKTRCDKLDFEWPTHDNQISIIETTKHGMRFHKSDLAFAQRAKPKVWASDDRVKFDLFELFKPKTTSTEAPSSSTATDDSSSEQPTETSTPNEAEILSTTPGDADDLDNPETTTAEPEEGATEPDGASTDPDGESSTVTSVPGSGTRDAPAAVNSSRLMTTFRLDTRYKAQKMMGFGGALSDATCRNIKSLSPQMAKSLMEDYYGDRGIRYTFVRMSVGSSDFSTTPYTNNDRPANQSNSLRWALDPEDDVEMKNFRLVEEDFEYKLPVARQAIATSSRKLKFFASLWSPPIWMKDNNNIVHGNLKGDIFGPYYRALAELMIKWLEAYRKSGIEFWGFTSLNEPVTGVMPFIFHNSLGISQEDYITFYKIYLGPLMRQRNFSKTKLMILDDNKGHVPFLVKSFLEDREASRYIDGIAIHWYMNDDYDNLNMLVKNHSDKFVLATEACNGYVGYQRHTLPGDWDRGVAYMLDITRVIQKSAVGWVDWNMVLNVAGGPSWAKNFLDAAILVNSQRDEYYKSPMFYAMGHFSRFVEPDSVRLEHRMGNARYDYPLEATAFYTPTGYIVIVAVNANRHLVPFRVIVDKELVRVVTLKKESFTTIVFKWRSRFNAQ